MRNITKRITFQKIEPLPYDAPLTAELMKSLGIRGLHCGSGPNIKLGCLNTDFSSLVDQNGCTTKAGEIYLVDDSFYYLQHDATKPFPIQNNSFLWIYSEHFIEHIEQSLVVEWFKEMRRLLLPKGIIRVSTPDLEKYIRGYLDPKSVFFQEHVKRLKGLGFRNVPDRPAWLVNQIFQLYGHKHIYDFDELVFTANLAGFSTNLARNCQYNSSALQELADLDREIRNDESLYVELESD